MFGTRLTRMERRIVAELARTGASNAELAQTFTLSPKTIKAHMGRIFVKLGVSSRAELIVLVYTVRDDLLTAVVAAV